MKRRSIAGNIGIGIFVIALVTVVVSFCSASWLVSDYRITNAKLDRLGLWTHCYRSLPDPKDEYQRRFFVGCRWIYDPFTAGWDTVRGFLVPDFMIATQFFYTLTFIAVLIDTVLVLMFFLFLGPDNKHFISVIKAIGLSLLCAGISGGIAVSVFAGCANRKGWMLGQENNFFGWSFALAVIGSFACAISGILFLTESNIQYKKRKYLKESQTRFQINQETEA